jgi:hypothetical protein
MRALRALLPAIVVLALAPPAVAAPQAAEFQVGAETQNTDPTTDPVYSGGFGLSDPITKVHDPLEVRAFYVSNGKHAVAIAVVDAQAVGSPLTRTSRTTASPTRASKRPKRSRKPAGRR